MGRRALDDEQLVGVGLRLHPNEVTSIELLAQARNLSRGEMIRQLVRFALKAQNVPTLAKSTRGGIQRISPSVERFSKKDSFIAGKK